MHRRATAYAERAMDGTADLPHELGALLRSHRSRLGLTQRELAARAGLSARTIQDLERGLAVPHRTTMKRLLAALGLRGEQRRAFEAALRKKPPPTSISSNLPLELTSF